MKAKKEFGDFQTPQHLASQVVALVNQIYGKPEVIVEPTVGLGAFIAASLKQWGDAQAIEGYEINEHYVKLASKMSDLNTVLVRQSDFFSENWSNIIRNTNFERVLILGNPPWVTNTELSTHGGNNLPVKSNFRGLRGLDARTGKSNFDIAEWMLVKLIDAMPDTGFLAMLCKTSTARKVLKYFWEIGAGFKDTNLFTIDAKSDFNVAVDACLFTVSGIKTSKRNATVHKSLSLISDSTQFGYINGSLVSNINDFNTYHDLDGGSTGYRWRSGVKHDASKVMELIPDGSYFRNGFNEIVEIEKDFVFPLLKSSDIAHQRVKPRRFVIVPQKSIDDDTNQVKLLAPMTWKYLTSHAEILDGRKSSIYNNRPRFSVFGVGQYSFSPCKIAISGLYKSLSFVLIPPYNDSPVFLDDTCYFMPCSSFHEAEFILNLLQSNPAQKFLKSLVFWDSKRPVTIDILRRISLIATAERLGKNSELNKYFYSEKSDGFREQLTLQF